MPAHSSPLGSRWLPVFLAGALAAVLLPVLTDTAAAAPPEASFLTPNDDGPGDVVSDKPSSAPDDTYEFLLRIADPDGGTITSVVLEIEDGDADADFEAMAPAPTRVGTTDVWSTLWNQSAHTPASDVDADAGRVRAVITDSAGEVTTIEQAVFFADATAETAALTSARVLSETATAVEILLGGDASAGATSVSLFYTTTVGAGTDPVYTACGTATVGPGTDGAPQHFSGTCRVDAPRTSVTGFAVRPGGGTAQSGHAGRFVHPASTTTTTTTTTTPGATGPQPAGEQGYALVAADGGIFNFGTSKFFGSTGGTRLNQAIVAMDHTPTTAGYWLAAADGGIFAFGDAEFFGSTGAMRLAKPIVGVRGTPTGDGYWLVASDGGIFAFGDAKFFGSTGAMRLNQPIVGMERTPSGNGYWLVAADGGIFAFGDAVFRGSTGAMRLNKPIVAMSRSNSGLGYHLVATDGGVFAFGDAVFRGSTGAITLNSPITAMAPTAAGNGYWLCARDGGVFAFGNAQFRGSMGATRLNQPVVGCDAPLAQTGVRT